MHSLARLLRSRKLLARCLVTEPTKREIQAAFGQRVYEYHDDKGTVYYSFTQAPNIISPPKRLKMQNRIGVHLVNFVTRLRRLSDSMQVPEGTAGRVPRVEQHPPPGRKP